MKNDLTSIQTIERRARKITTFLICVMLALAVTASPAFAEDDPLQIVENLSDVKHN